MSLVSSFKNVGHAIASGAKYFEHLVVDALKVASKVQQFEPQIDAVVGALAGPQAEAISSLSFHALGAVYQALDSANDSAVAAVAQNGVNVQLDAQAIQDIKKFGDLIKQLLAAKGTPAPAKA